MPTLVKKQSGLASKLKNVPKQSSKLPPVWEGPQSDGPQGGITQGLIQKWLADKERYRILTIEGLAKPDEFKSAMEYGNFYHCAEEAVAGKKDWAEAIKQHGIKLVKQYPQQSEQIDHWMQVARAQFPIYLEWWYKHEREVNRVSLMQEQVFKVPYTLPSGRVVYLRGKWDGVSLVGKGRERGLFLDEMKSKSEIDERVLKIQLTCDLQTMLYAVAFTEWQKVDDYGEPIRFPEVVDGMCWDGKFLGVRYNVIRRPLSGGRGSIRQHQPTKAKPEGETKAEFYERLSGVIRDDVEPGGDHGYFRRWKCEVSAIDIEIFKQQCLNPVLENICDDYEWWNYCHGCGVSPFAVGIRTPGGFANHSPRHFRMPFGCWNALAESGFTEYDDYLSTGSQLGLVRTDDLFRELNS